MQEIGEKEPSGRIDYEFIYAFYSLILSSKYSKIFYKSDKAGNILSLCCIFTNYTLFSLSLKLRLIPIVIKKIISKEMSIFRLIKSFNTSPNLTKVPNKSCHLGMILRSSSFSPASIYYLSKNIDEALDYLKNIEFKSVWASARIENTNSISLLKEYNFK